MAKKKTMGDEPQSAGSKRPSRHEIAGRVLELQHAALLVLSDANDDPDISRINNAVRSLLDQYWRAT